MSVAWSRGAFACLALFGCASQNPAQSARPIPAGIDPSELAQRAAQNTAEMRNDKLTRPS